MRIMWINLVQTFPFSNHLLTQQQLKVMLEPVLERLMIAEVCTSAPGVLRRAEKTSNVKLPFLCASLKPASLISLSKALLIVERLFQKRATA